MMFKNSIAEKQILPNTKKIAEPIKPSDDAFHGSLKHISAEWWYFDALFSNNHSIHIGLKTFSKKKYGMFAPLIEFYKHGELVHEETKRILFKDVDISKEYPSIIYDNQEIMNFNLEKYKESNQWEYNVKMKTDKCSFDLSFLGNTPGWKIETPEESWTVAQPKAQVQGTINLNGEKKQVQGLGYHDHNWNYNIVTVMNYGQGWYWGKIASKSYNIVWAKIEKSKKKYEILAVFNKDNQKFYNINPKNIELEIDEYVKVGRYKAPSHFILNIKDSIDNIPIEVDVEMDSYGIHYNSVIVAPYFRYHVKSKGSISIDTKKEEVNDRQIMEFLRFS